jgi:hypothetical protein
MLPDTARRSGGADRFLPALLVAVAGAVGIAQFGRVPLLLFDSDSYIHFSGTRGLGYPTFLFILRSVGIPLEGVPWVQLALHLATLPVLFGALRRSIGNLWLPSLIILLVSINPRVAQYHGQILSESLFLSLIVLFVSAVLRYQNGCSRQNLLFVSGLAALSITLKPVGWAFVMLVLLVLASRLAWQNGRGAALAAFVLPLVLVVSVEHIASRFVHGSARESLAPRHIFAKAGMVEATVPNALLASGPNAPLHRALERDVVAIRRLVERAPEENIARYLTGFYEVLLQVRFAPDVARGLAAKDDLGQAFLEAGLERLRYGWRGYLVLTARHYLSLWLPYDESHPALNPTFNAFVLAERPLPYEAPSPVLVKTVTPAGLKAVVVRPIIAASGLFTALLAAVGLICLLWPNSISPLWRQAGLLALGLHGYCLLVALTGVGINRYLLGVWPLLVCSLGLAFAAALPWCRNVASRAIVALSGR